MLSAECQDLAKGKRAGFVRSAQAPCETKKDPSCSTVGRLLAARLHCPFFEGDDYHPKVNKGTHDLWRSLVNSCLALT